MDVPTWNLRSHPRELEPRSWCPWFKWTWVHSQERHCLLPWVGLIWDRFQLHRRRFPNTFLSLSLLMFSQLEHLSNFRISWFANQNECLFLNDTYVVFLHFMLVVHQSSTLNYKLMASKPFLFMLVFSTVHISGPCTQEMSGKSKNENFLSLGFSSLKSRVLQRLSIRFVPGLPFYSAVCKNLIRFQWTEKQCII